MAAIYSQAWENTLCTLAGEARHPALPRTPVPVSDRQLLERAYARCEAVIAEHGKTFNLASRLLPAPKRRAIRPLYAFCRVADNIVDCEKSAPEAREAHLLAWRRNALSASPPREDLVATAWSY
jgi:15-cis-phytoene synthase